jgi:hypothetical protein
MNDGFESMLSAQHHDDYELWCENHQNKIDEEEHEYFLDLETKFDKIMGYV